MGFYRATLDDVEPDLRGSLQICHARNQASEGGSSGEYRGIWWLQPSQGGSPSHVRIPNVLVLTSMTSDGDLGNLPVASMIPEDLFTSYSIPLDWFVEFCWHPSCIMTHQSNYDSQSPTDPPMNIRHCSRSWVIVQSCPSSPVMPRSKLGAGVCI